MVLSFTYGNAFASNHDRLLVYDTSSGQTRRLSDGTPNQVVKTDGNGNISWTSSAGGGGGTWGSISGTLSAQTDLQTALNAKESLLVNSAGLAAALSNETGSGFSVFATSPSISTPTMFNSSLTGINVFDSGSVSSPSLAFSGDLSTGIYQPASSQIGISVGGVYKATFTSSGLTLSNPLAIASGGCGAGSYQSCLNNLFQVPSTDGYVATYDSGTGNVLLKAPSGGLFTNTASTIDYQTTLTNQLILGATSFASTRLGIVGTADVTQLAVKGNGTQTSPLANFLTSGSVSRFKVDNDGTTTFGGTGSGTIAIDKFKINSSVSDDTFTGTVVSLTAGENVVIGDICYMKSDGKAWKADADAIATSSALFISTGTTLADASGVFGIEGFLRDDSGYALTVGGLVYLSTTTGAITQTAPSGTDDVVQALGVAISADIFYFRPNLVQVEHT